VRQRRGYVQGGREGGEAVKRLVEGLFIGLVLAFAGMPVVLAQQPGILERVESKLDQVLQLLQKGVPPVVPPAVDPVTPTVPPATGPSCNYLGPYLINAQGTVNNVCACPSVHVSLRNVMPGGRISIVKMPGTGQPAVPLGIFTVSEGGRAIGSSGSGLAADMGMGDRELTITAERCTNLSVQLR
jgi:hypothetical protein